MSSKPTRETRVLSAIASGSAIFSAFNLTNVGNRLEMRGRAPAPPMESRNGQLRSEATRGDEIAAVASSRSRIILFARFGGGELIPPTCDKHVVCLARRLPTALISRGRGYLPTF